jgi:hypothetical protein
LRYPFSSADGRLAADWHRRGVSLEQVEHAICPGLARKYTALVNHRTGAQITTLRYFENLIDEVIQADSSPDEWRHLVARTKQFECRWRSLQASSPDADKSMARRNDVACAPPGPELLPAITPCLLTDVDQ